MIIGKFYQNQKSISAVWDYDGIVFHKCSTVEVKENFLEAEERK